MKIPKKINPDRLVDAIVAVRFESDLPAEVLLGVIFQSLNDSYIYSNKNISKNQFPNGNSVKNSLFYNDRIKVMVLENSLIFNILTEYIGWEHYKKEISNFIELIQKKGSPIKTFTKASVRYISEYKDVDLRNILNFNFTFGMSDVKSEVFTFRSEFEKDKQRVFLHLQNKIISKRINNDLNKISVIDIDVMNDRLTCSNIQELLEEISKAHNLENEIYFNLLKEDFLKTLNPIY